MDEAPFQDDWMDRPKKTNTYDSGFYDLEVPDPLPATPDCYLANAWSRHGSMIHEPQQTSSQSRDNVAAGYDRRDHQNEHLRAYHHMDAPKRRATTPSLALRHAKQCCSRPGHSGNTPNAGKHDQAAITTTIEGSDGLALPPLFENLPQSLVVQSLSRPRSPRRMTIAEPSKEPPKSGLHGQGTCGKAQEGIPDWLCTVQSPSSPQSQFGHIDAQAHTARSYYGSPGCLPHELDKIRSDEGSSDYADSDMLESSGSVLGDSDLPWQTAEGPQNDLSRRLKSLYANCLYWLIYGQVIRSWQINERASGDDTTGSSQSNSISGSGYSLISQGKRRRGNDSEPGKKGNDDGREDDDDNCRSPQSSKKPRAKTSSTRRFACPFFKRHAHIFISCGMADHESPSRVKLHISRKHKLPIYCARCSDVFKYERERDLHLRENTCLLQPEVPRICATSEQLQRLSKRSTGKSDEERWNEIYTILFPGDPLPDSPYLDSTVSADVNLVREAFLHAAPSAVRTAVRMAIPGSSSQIADDELDQILLSTHVQVFDQILSAIRSTRSSTQGNTTQLSSYLNTSGTPDSGSGINLTAGDLIQGPGLVAESQVNTLDPTFVQGDTTLPSSMLEADLEEMAMMYPINWCFDQFDDLPA
ncbi:hypothetical protein BJX99DRAFT_265767 [Aspergillus californicus]